jgi:hypothetical protein
LNGVDRMASSICSAVSCAAAAEAPPW